MIRSSYKNISTKRISIGVPHSPQFSVQPFFCWPKPNPTKVNLVMVDWLASAQDNLNFRH